METSTRNLADQEHLELVTELLLSIRSEDRYAAPYEAADLQWWWRDGDWGDPELQTYWLIHDSKPVAGFLKYDEGDRWACDCFWLPSAQAVVEKEVWPVVLRELQLLAGDKPVCTTVDEREEKWRAALESSGWQRSGESQVQMAQEPATPPEPLALPPGFILQDETERDGEYPHPLSKRNGSHIVERLNECSLYNPELDLLIKDPDGTVAAHCICWVDRGNQVGLFEPVRTEEEFQRRGLGLALMTEGIRRMMASDAVCIKVSHNNRNVAAQRLYRAAGFRPLFHKFEYVAVSNVAEPAGG